MSGLTLPPHLAGRAALRPRDLGEAFGISKPKVRALIVAGKLDAWSLDGVCLVSRESVERWLATAKAAK
jgi:hypothetical protein